MVIARLVRLGSAHERQLSRVPSDRQEHVPLVLRRYVLEHFHTPRQVNLHGPLNPVFGEIHEEKPL